MTTKYVVAGSFSSDQLELYVKTYNGWCRMMTAINDYKWHFFDTEDDANKARKTAQEQAESEAKMAGETNIFTAIVLPFDI